MPKYYKNPPPLENYTKPKPPPCPPAPPSREFICNMFGFVESKESISKREEYVKNKDEGIPYNIIGNSGIMVADAEDVRKCAKHQFDKCNEYFNNQQTQIVNQYAVDTTKEDIEQIEKLLEKHIKWLSNLPIPTQGCLHQMMNVVGEAQRMLTKMKNDMEKHN